MTDRRQAIENLRKLIAEQKARIDPKLLERAGKAATSRQAKESDTIPYDKEAAKQAVALFLKSHGDGDGFGKKLLDFMRKKSH